jgi:LCP family protein required for cell wall assembly
MRFEGDVARDRPGGEVPQRELPEDMRRSLDRYRGKAGYQRPVPAGSAARPPAVRRRRHWLRWLALLLVALLLVVIGLVVFWDGKLKRVNALRSYSGRPAATAGTNWLVVGSDSRSDLTAKQKQQLATGDAAGSRTDTIMLVHTGSGPTSLVSLPRDTYVPIAGHGSSKLNAAYSLGGPALLTRTVEQLTGLRINHFAELGFGGFAGMVDAVGGVRLCLPTALKDPKAGLDVPAGCQTLNGTQALGYVRTRASARADLDRVVHQRMFLAALTAKAASPGVLLNPFASVPLVSKAVDSLSVDNGTHLWHLVALARAMHGLSGGSGVTATAPIGGESVVAGAGDVVTLDRSNALRMFRALAQDKAIPTDLVSH